VQRSTIGREFKRNVANPDPEGKDYRVDAAQELTDQRHRDRPKHDRFSEELKPQWLTKYKLYPEFISGCSQVKGGRWGFP